jgi:hypothetical protein
MDPQIRYCKIKRGLKMEKTAIERLTQLFQDSNKIKRKIFSLRNSTEKMREALEKKVTK